ncbi:hypothetical protein BU24DRAFT_482831 [Aaosphaeria arxii CBS 175.79]|uniref:2-hydroxyacyl-CoA lyase n=1 Tax=Aaosphaeria arxii CBS 175.79 TaxID=1450172 RepID=A0A6A5XJP4_9PLEO|nr:uncharacterized protein BU24DRAFT_482831 [Aaosphaeria arxii CBS 175.79]KAF2013099.1 hypothetical protein BU24DRAFT_482831 [Aaosphaeria arxii CBS 175.79]
MEQPNVTGAYIIAKTLKDLQVSVIFGVVGVPITDIAEQAIDLGIRFIGFRNEQAASYAATAYGYLTGRPGVCLVVGGPGILHAIAGVGNASENNFPLLLLGGSAETHLISRGAFQELDSISLLTPHSKSALRPSSASYVPNTIAEAYRRCWYGRPGVGFVDLPANVIMEPLESIDDIDGTLEVTKPPSGAAQEVQLQKIVGLIQTAKAPLVLIGKGAAYARAEEVIRTLIERTKLPFLPSPMGKGVVPDSHPQNVASARSMALKMADVVLILGARLNWIFHYGAPPKWNPKVRFLQVDISPEEIGRNAANAGEAILGDVRIVVAQLIRQFAGWQYKSTSSDFMAKITESKARNEAAAARAASNPSAPLTYSQAFELIRTTLHSISPPQAGGIVYIAEGSNTMDFARSVFPVEFPRLRLDAGSYATMGVGLGYAIAAHEAYNSVHPQASSGPYGRKKIIAIEGDSAFGFSAMEIETMARLSMDVLIIVINNSGIYFSGSRSADDWSYRRDKSAKGEAGLRSHALSWEVKYDQLAEAVGGMGFFVRTPEELHRAVIAGFHAKVPVVVNVIIKSSEVEKPVGSP